MIAVATKKHNYDRITDHQNRHAVACSANLRRLLCASNNNGDCNGRTCSKKQDVKTEGKSNVEQCARRHF